MAIRTKVYKVRLDDLKDDGSYVAYISLFGDNDNLDKDGDFFKGHAWNKTIKKRKGVFPGVYMHNITRPVSLGHVEKDQLGLVVKAQINLDITDGQETYSNMKKGLMGDHSIGFNSNKNDVEILTDKKGVLTGGYGFGECELLEYSSLTIGIASNEGASLIALKWRNASLQTEGDVFNDNTDVDSIEEVDSLEQAKAMEALIADIKGLTLNINQYCERR